MGDLTRTFGGLIIMAHGVNSQSLYVIPFIHILDTPYYLIYIIINNYVINMLPLIIYNMNSLFI